MITLAIDASTHSTGVAVFKDKSLIHYKCIQNNDNNVFKRIKYMNKKILQIYYSFKPDRIVMEEILPDDVKHNQKVYKALVYLQAAIVLALDQVNQSVQLVPASHWRKIYKIKTGVGIKRQNLKKQSQQLIKSIYNIDVNDDISDAICLGMAYIKQHGSAF